MQLQLPQRQTQLPPLPLEPGSLEEATRAATLTSLATFGETFEPGWRAAAFHELLANKLEDCLRRKIKRLIINVPPQHGKSREASVIFPAFALTKFPTMRILQAGHTGDLSKGFSRAARNLVQSRAYLHLYPELINPRVNREDYWETRLGGYYFATSVGGGTGMPADLLLVDDPHRDRAEANSKAKRDRVWDWFVSTAQTRLSPDGIVIVIQTRWHRDDLAGRLQDPKRIKALKDAGLEDMNFEVLSLEAVCENPQKDALGRKFGEALWPEVRNERWLLGQKLQIGPFEWNSLYQQRPNPPGGNLCDVKKIKIIPISAVPKDLRVGRGWDLAISEATTADYSAGVKGGTRRVPAYGRDGRPIIEDGKQVMLTQLYIFHVDRGKRAWPEQKATIINYATNIDRLGEISVEAVQGWQVAAQQLEEQLQGRCAVVSYRPVTDKVTRALPWLATIAADNMFLVEGDWNQDYLDELEQFPNCTNDDQVDATTVLWESTYNAETFVWA
jgi:predicted phage terminase large subunit-like protein